nr:MAG TPA: hypothetical protein [Caudoviricetes sp.]
MQICATFSAKVLHFCKTLYTFALVNNKFINY